MTECPAPNIKIDRLALDLPGFNPADAGMLALLIARHLAQAGNTASDISIPRLNIILATPDTDLDILARRIAGAVLRRA